MTAASAPVLTRPARVERGPWLSTARLLLLELRHNAMFWMLPVPIAAFWYTSYRKTLAMPPLWYLSAVRLQSGVVTSFIVPVVGAAAWMGSREARRRMTDLMTITARPRWARLLVTWVATAIWSLVGYGVCLAVVYGVSTHQASWGGPLWWPVAVTAASVMAFSALGFAAGSLLPGRLTAPLVAVGSFFVLVLSTELITGGQSYWQISPVVTGPWDLSDTPGIATFYPYVPDLSLAQLMFLAGLTLAVLSAVAWPASGRRVRAASAVVAAVGLLAAGTAVRLAGTGTMGAGGMISIPALHDTASDRPLRFTPVCSRGAIPVCLNPAYSGYLPAVSAVLSPLLKEIVGLPGAPVRVTQVAATYHQGAGDEVDVSAVGASLHGQPPEFGLLLPDHDQTGGPFLTTSELAGQVRVTTGPAIAASFVGDGPGASDAQHAVAAALSTDAGMPAGTDNLGLPVPPGSKVQSRDGTGPPQQCSGIACSAGGTGKLDRGSPLGAARRFAALPLAARRAWLAQHLTALRAGRITLAQLP
jgi:hypothetical protein